MKENKILNRLFSKVVTIKKIFKRVLGLHPRVRFLSQWTQVITIRLTVRRQENAYRYLSQAPFCLQKF